MEFVSFYVWVGNGIIGYRVKRKWNVAKQIRDIKTRMKKHRNIATEIGRVNTERVTEERKEIRGGCTCECYGTYEPP